MLDLTYDESTNTFTASYPAGADMFDYNVSKPDGTHWGTSINSTTYGEWNHSGNSAMNDLTKTWQSITSEPETIIGASAMRPDPPDWVRFTFYTNRGTRSAATTVYLTKAD